MTRQQTESSFQGLLRPRRDLAILSLCLSTATIVLDGAIANVALPSISRALAIDEAHSVLVVTVYQLTLVICLLPLAALGDRLGHARVFQAGLTLLFISCGLCCFIDSLWPLLGLRFLQALGSALALSVSSALLRHIYPHRVLGRGLALNSMMVSLFSSAAPVIGGIVLEYTGWPMIFAAIAPLALCALLLSPSMPEMDKISEPYDWFAAGLYMMTMLFIFVGLSGLTGIDQPWIRVALLFAGIVSGYRLIRHQLASSAPLLPVDLVRQPLLGATLTGGVIGFTASMAVLILIPFRLDDFHHFRASEVGLLMSAWPITTLVVAPLSGLASDRVPAWLLGSTSLAFAAIGLALLATVDQQAAPVDIVWRIALCGAGFAGFFTSNQRLLLASSPRSRAAAMGGLIATVRLIGQSLGAIFAAGLLGLGLLAKGTFLLLPALLVCVAIMFSLSRGTVAQDTAA